jgi:hypothetical protein
LHDADGIILFSIAHLQRVVCVCTLSNWAGEFRYALASTQSHEARCRFECGDFGELLTRAGAKCDQKFASDLIALNN